MEPKRTVWILTKKHNSCDQHGEFYLKVYAQKPTNEMIMLKIKEVEEEALRTSSNCDEVNYKNKQYTLIEEII